ncbi:shikimate dehydrogenase family protein [Luteococcus sp. Sow4_B9]|uniref:shikimate dehydrogenase family protein n=1 Tax=Luteococcus sp. Sow4_B9 TaxID=3438792 RepID=UPI003F97BD6D
MTVRTTCAVIGHPAGHSLSPALHRAAYRELGLDWDYRAIDVAPADLEAFVTGLGPEWRALSVTMPHKAAIRRFGATDELVDLVGAGNTLLLGAEPMVRNTDVGGFLLALSVVGIESTDSATIIGNGATATSAAVALRELGVERVTVLARRPERAKGLRTFCTTTLGMLCDVRPLEAASVVPGDIVVSTVPEGGADHIANELAEQTQVLFDSIYDPWPSALALAAEARRRTVLSGLDLLAGQAVEQVRLMTGGQVAFEMLKSAGQEELNRRAGL